MSQFYLFAEEEASVNAKASLAAKPSSECAKTTCQRPHVRGKQLCEECLMLCEQCDQPKVSPFKVCYDHAMQLEQDGKLSPGFVGKVSGQRLFWVEPKPAQCGRVRQRGRMLCDLHESRARHGVKDLSPENNKRCIEVC